MMPLESPNLACTQLSPRLPLENWALYVQGHPFLYFSRSPSFRPVWNLIPFMTRLSHSPGYHQSYMAYALVFLSKI